MLCENSTDKDSQSSGQGSAQLLENIEMPQDWQDCFRQELVFVFQGERGLFYIRQFVLVWAFTGEQMPNDATFPA